MDVTKEPRRGSLAWVAQRFEEVFDELRELRKAGQLEYAGGEATAFGNFERLAVELDMTREAVLWVYAKKHADGIASWIRGHKSQREGVEGRINDLLVYLLLLRCMVEDRKAGTREEVVGKFDDARALRADQ